MTTSVRKKLIEVSIPLEAINAESSKRKQKAPKGYPTAIHKYWAQRPIAACRAVLFAQLVDDPTSWPTRFPTDASQEEERRRLHKVMEGMLSWEASNDQSLMTAARWEIARSVAWDRGEEPPSITEHEAVLEYVQTYAPTMYDPFSGSGSIPLEAQRLGLRVHASDLNPVAVLLGKAMIEIPFAFTNTPPMNPISYKEAELGQTRRWTGAEGLAEDVRYYGKWIHSEVSSRLGRYYPGAKSADGRTGIVVAWLWARTVKSPDPRAAGAMVPLASSFVLSNKEGRKVWVNPIIDGKAQDGYRFDVKSGVISKTEEIRARKGTKAGRGSSFSCVLTGSAIDPEYVKTEGMAGRLGTRLMAIVADIDGTRRYVSPTIDHETIAHSAMPAWEPTGDLPHDPRNFWVAQYGLTSFSSLFTTRQLLAATTCCDLIAEARNNVVADAASASWDADPARLSTGGRGAEAYGDAVATYLALAVDRMLFYGSSLCGWLPKDNAMGQAMKQQSLAMSWDFAEGNPIGKSSSNVMSCANVVADCLSELKFNVGGNIGQADAREVSYPSSSFVCTDPPYYDNFAYADLSDFFYPWLKSNVGSIFPDLFRRIQTPKDDELVATPYRHGGVDAAEQFFMAGMGSALKRMTTAAGAVPTVIYYAFKQQEQSQIGITSAGWAGFLQAIVNAGFVIDGTWPVRTENPGRSIAQGANALASSIVLVCRRRDTESEVITRADFIRALKAEMPAAIQTIRKAGVGPVDMQQSVIGPGMGVFSRHAKVLEDDDSAMSVKTALAVINRVWEEIENELDQAFDPETQVALAWFSTYGFDARASGELITLTTAKNTSDRALFASGVFKDMKGKAGLTPREELPPGWSPASDKTLTTWECVQHTARVLNAADGGGEAAAALVAQMGPKAEEARALAYRLFEIATNKGWAAEALVYNELAQEWSKLEDRAATLDDTGGAPGPNQTAFTFDGSA
jgi:putative DNA methylase